MRSEPTKPEDKLWQLFRNRLVNLAKFRRQEPIGPFIVDFVSYEYRLIIEVDGGQHAENLKDEARDRWLISQRFQILRFWNDEILTSADGVVDVISHFIATGLERRADSLNHLDRSKLLF